MVKWTLNLSLLLLYGSETWPMKVDDMQRLVRTENNMVRWRSGVTLKDRRTSEVLRHGLGIESVERVVSRGRLRWFGHVERRVPFSVRTTRKTGPRVNYYA